MQGRYLLAFPLICLVVIALLGRGSAQQPPNQPTTQNFKAGQVWSYKTAPGAEESKVLILQVESGKKGVVVHVRIDDIPVPGCGSFRIKTSIEHIAITEKTLRNSITRLTSENVKIPDSYFDAYKEWQKGRRTVTTKLLGEVALPMPVCPIMKDQPATT